MRRSVALAVSTVLLGACAGGEPGVRVDTLQADVVFGVEEPAVGEVAAPPPVVPVTEGAPVARPLVVPFRNQVPDRFANVPVVPPTQVAGDCPDAPLGAAPETIAPTNAVGAPAEGLYRFKIEGTQTTTSNGVDVVAPIQGFEPRIIRAVDQVSDTLVRYEIVAPSEDGGTEVTTLSVNSAPIEFRDPTTGGVGVDPPYVGENPVRVGEPGRGVALESITTFDAAGNQVGQFDPVVPVLLMPLPVLQGEQFQAVGIDASTSQVMAVQGETLDRRLVDACGAFVDGWLVRLAVTDVRRLSSSERVQELVIAPHLGGLVVSDREIRSATVTEGVSVTIDVTTSIGQLEPSALPEGAA